MELYVPLTKGKIVHVLLECAVAPYCSLFNIKTNFCELLREKGEMKKENMTLSLKTTNMKTNDSLKKTEMCIFKCMHMTSHCSLNINMRRLFIPTYKNTQAHRDVVVDVETASQLGGIENCISGKRRPKTRREKGIGLSGFASWLASPHLSSFLEWSATYQSQDPQDYMPASSPNLFWHWSHQTSQASCLL